MRNFKKSSLYEGISAFLGVCTVIFIVIAVSKSNISATARVTFRVLALFSFVCAIVFSALTIVERRKNGKVQNRETADVDKFLQFRKNYLNTQCEGDIITLKVLTGYNIGGAAKSRGEEYYSSSVKCIAYINQNNELVQDDITFTYFLLNTAHLQFLHIENLHCYSIKCKKVKDRNLYYIIQLKKTKEKRFEPIIEEESRPIVISVNDTEFKFDKILSWYDGKVEFNGYTIDISLKPKENTLDATTSVATYKRIMEGWDNFYKKVLTRCANELVEGANEWRDEDDEHEITAEEFLRRIDTKKLSISIDGNNYTLYFDDDNLFWGHTIVYDGNIENDEFSINIEG
ncbi:MAG: DUF2262 domain-containing protein [Clostridiales bacterium]|nr:DUF2262 domain-containing protein [Clostridiales bacterium]